MSSLTQNDIDDLHIIMILDESSSMETIRKNIIDSVNNFIKEQKSLKIGNPKFTLVKFSTDVKYIYKKINLDDANDTLLNYENYHPCGVTSLYDGIGIPVTHYTKDKTVCLVIITDGEENNSRKFNYKTIKQLLDVHQKKGWNVIYLSTDLNTKLQGERLGFRRSATCDNITVPMSDLGLAIQRSCSSEITRLRSNPQSGLHDIPITEQCIDQLEQFICGDIDQSKQFINQDTSQSKQYINQDTTQCIYQDTSKPHDTFSKRNIINTSHIKHIPQSYQTTLSSDNCLSVTSLFRSKTYDQVENTDLVPINNDFTESISDTVKPKTNHCDIM